MLWKSLRTQPRVSEFDGDCFVGRLNSNPLALFGEPGVCPTIVLFSFTTHQFPIGGFFSAYASDGARQHSVGWE